MMSGLRVALDVDCALLLCVHQVAPPLLRPPSSAALLGLDEAVLLLGPQLHLGVAGAAALVAELHGGPVAVAALLQQEGGR